MFIAAMSAGTLFLASLLRSQEMKQSIKSSVSLDLIGFIGTFFLFAILSDVGINPVSSDEEFILALVIGALCISIIIRTALYFRHGHTNAMLYWNRFERWWDSRQQKIREKNRK